MSKLYSMLSVLVLTMGVTFSGWAVNPCLSIARACMEEGYYKGGYKVGKGLVENCVMPIVEHRKIIPKATFSRDVLQQCNVMLQERIQERH